MKEGTFDIPSIKFKVLYRNGDLLSFMDIKCLYSSTNKIKQANFEQVDGLTVGQMLEIFKTRGFLLSALVDRTDPRVKNDKDYKVIFNVNFIVNRDDLDKEISKYILEKLVSLYCENNISENYPSLVKSAVLTFCERYVCKNSEDIKNFQKVLKQSKTNNYFTFNS